MTAIMIMAGGTGGHVYPALAVADALRDLGHQVSWLGTRAGLEASVVPDAGISIDWIRISGLRGQGMLAWLGAPFKLVAAIAQAYTVMRRRKPRVVLGMGGFVAGPGGVAAWLSRRPLVIHEQNAVAGLTNRSLAPLASAVLEAFPGSFDSKHQARHVGNPVRDDIAAIATPEQRIAARRGPIQILVLGGSQGALALNQTVPEAVALLEPAARPRLWHQAGKRTLIEAEKAYQEHQVEARIDAYITDMAEAYAWADLVICRAGALTVAELAAAGVGAVLVPYPLSIDDHQTLNAEFLERVGAGSIIQQSELTAQRLAATLQPLCSNRDQLLHMASQARSVAITDATGAVSEVCLAVAQQGQSSD